MRILEKVGLLTLLALFTWAPIAAASYWLAPKEEAPKTVETSEHASERYLRLIRIAKSAPGTEVASTVRESAPPNPTLPSSPPETNIPDAMRSEVIAHSAAMRALPLDPPAAESALRAEPVKVRPKNQAKRRAVKKNNRRYVKRDLQKIYERRSAPSYATRSAPQEVPFLFGFFN